MQIQIVNGIYTDEASDFRTSYPRNLMPIAKQNGISNGYLKPADGIELFAEGKGKDRGGINWNDQCYRVMGGNLVKVTSTGFIQEIGFIGGASQVTLDYSFEYLGIASEGSLYLYNGTSLQKITDADLGNVVDFIWVDGYFLTTDGEFLVVTDLNDPFQINPLKYGSSEVDPDPVKAILKIKNEPVVLNRYTIEVFNNTGGSGFPFQRVDGAQVQRGVVGTHACSVFMDNVAFVGSARNEPVSIWIAGSGSNVRISTREIETILHNYDDSVLKEILVETRADKEQDLLYVHLPDKTLVYDGSASKQFQQPIWFQLTSGIGVKQYRAKNLVWCYNKWIIGDPLSNNIGILVSNISSHWGKLNEWQFGTIILYNEGRGLILHELELVCLSGRVNVKNDPVIRTEYSLDGEIYSMPRYVKSGKRGQRNTRIVWINQGNMRNWRLQKFTGTSDSHLSIARLEARIEALSF